MRKTAAHLHENPHDPAVDFDCHLGFQHTTQHGHAQPSKSKQEVFYIFTSPMFKVPIRHLENSSHVNSKFFIYSLSLVLNPIVVRGFCAWDSFTDNAPMASNSAFHLRVPLRQPMRRLRPSRWPTVRVRKQPSVPQHEPQPSHSFQSSRIQTLRQCRPAPPAYNSSVPSGNPYNRDERYDQKDRQYHHNGNPRHGRHQKPLVFIRKITTRKGFEIRFIPIRILHNAKS